MTVCGLLPALSVSLRLAVCVPVLVGAKVTLRTQLAPGFSVAGAVPQVVLDTENCFWFAPVMFHERFVSAPVPVLATVTGCVPLLPRVTVPKLIVDGLRVTVGEFTV